MSDKRIELDSSVTSVTVYSNRAMVTRRATAKQSSGISSFVFKDLPQNIERKSIQLNGFGNAVIKDINFSTENFVEIPDDLKKTLTESEIEIEDKIRVIDDSISRIKKEQSFIEAIAGKLTSHEESERPVELDPEKWMKMVTFYSEKLEKIYDEIRVYEKSKRSLYSELGKIKRDLGNLGTDKKQRNQVEASVESTEDAEVILELSYIVHGPSWIPLYDLRVSTDEKTMTVTYNALVKQNSSESWTEAEIRLSTAQAHISAEEPELSPWRLSLIEPFRARSLPPQPLEEPALDEIDMSLSLSQEEPEELYDITGSKIPDMEIPMETVSAGAETKSTSVVFHVPGTSTVNNDNNPQKIQVLKREFPAEFRYSSVPKLSPYAYLKAKVVNDTDFPFLPGETNVFLDNNFVANGKLDLVVPTEEFWTSLGIDEGMKVEYKFLKKFQKKEGVVSKKTVIIYQYEIVVTNNKKNIEEISIQDQIPISGNQEININLIEPKYKDDTDKLKKNEHDYIEWKFKPKPGEKIEIPFSFSVEYPKGKEISGLI